MIEHMFLPELDLRAIELRKPYRDWLDDWLRQIEPQVEEGNVSSSMCLEAIMAEIVLFGEPRYDWPAIFDEYLTDPDGKPLAYSQCFGERLYKFAGQWRQTPVHAVHTRFWAERLSKTEYGAAQKYAHLIEQFIQASGWIYNPEVSHTRLATRMKSEYLMSLAMGLEILDATGMLDEHRARFEATLSAQPLTIFLSSEYFRLRALMLLGMPQLVPILLNTVLSTCEAGEGYCDFSVSAKFDDYMGSAKRTERDEAEHSALSALHAGYIANHCDQNTQKSVSERVKHFRQHLLRTPFDMPAFKIRDIEFPFGTGLSPLEVIAASAICHRSTRNRE